MAAMKDPNDYALCKRGVRRSMTQLACELVEKEKEEVIEK
jgi:hypothetical protein